MNKLLFIHIILHSSTCFELKCSSSGGHIVYMQHMVPSLSTSDRGGRSVHRLIENSLCWRKSVLDIWPCMFY